MLSLQIYDRLMRILNITNGDSATTLMQRAGVPGDYLPWRDVLYDGPVPERFPMKLRFACGSVQGIFQPQKTGSAL